MLPKTTLLPLLIIASIISARSQSDKFVMGAKAGFNIATQEPIGSYPREASSIVRIHFGVVTETKLYQQFGLQAEFMYSGHGSKYTGITRVQLKSVFDYINVPMFLKWNVNDNFSIMAGPQFGMIFDQEFQDDRTGKVRKEDFSTKYSRFEISAGGGLEWKSDSGVGFYSRYVYGITDIDEGLPFLNFTRNKTFQFGFVYWF